MAPKDGPRGTQESPKSLPRSPKSAQQSPKKAPRRLMEATEGLQDAYFGVEVCKNRKFEHTKTHLVEFSREPPNALFLEVFTFQVYACTLQITCTHTMYYALRCKLRAMFRQARI